MYYKKMTDSIIFWRVIQFGVAPLLILIAQIYISKIEKNSKSVSSSETQKFQNKVLEDTDILKKNNELINKPELIIVQDVIFDLGKVNDYNISVKNVGKSVADNVNMIINYVSPKGSEFGLRIKEIAPGDKQVFKVKMVPDFAIKAANPNWEKERNIFLEKFNSNEQRIIFNIVVEYEWNGKKYTSKEYLFEHSFPNKITMW